MLEVPVKGNLYQLSIMPVMKQGNVSRRLLPILPALIPALKQFENGEAVEAVETGDAPDSDVKPTGNTLEALTAGFTQVAGVLSQMTDDDFEYVVNTCMQYVKRQAGNGWAAAWNKQAQVGMFDDMNLPVVLELTFRVVQHNLGLFF